MKRIFMILAILLLLAGLALLFWPDVEGHVLEQQTENAVEEFYAQRQEEKPHSELYEAMSIYNVELYYQRQESLRDPWAYEAAAFDLPSYGIEDAVIGILDIPAIDVSMPIFLGATKANLAKGAAVIGQTSMPIGGESTNCVIAGHRGYSGAAYFLHVPDLKVGDRVQITNLWETLEYTVSQTAIIAPDDVEKILIQDGRDMVTLLTCHPYASGGRQRFVVYCDRVGGE